MKLFRRVAFVAVLPLAMLLSLASGPLWAQPAFQPLSSRPQVLELFTSQGCMACPGANEALAKYANGNANVLALSYGVRIWDYLGWRDTTAQEDNLGRFKSYAARLSNDEIGTPYVVVNGQRVIKGRKVRTALDTPLADQANMASFAFAGTGAQGMVKLSFMGQAPKAFRIVTIGFKPGVVNVVPKSGDNKNRKIGQFNVVTSIGTAAKMADLSDTYAVRQCAPACALLLEDLTGGRIIGAAVWTAAP